MFKREIFFILFLGAIAGGCGAGREDPAGRVIKEGSMKVTSTAFNFGEMIPVKYTADGQDISPPLNIEGIPEDAKSLVLISDDPDAPMGDWVHWVVFNLSPDTNMIGEGEEPAGIPGNNSWGRIGYGGPAPPSGTHRYFFRVYALDTVLDLPGGADKKRIEKAMSGHVLESAELMGRYSRR